MGILELMCDKRNSRALLLGLWTIFPCLYLIIAVVQLFVSASPSWSLLRGHQVESWFTGSYQILEIAVLGVYINLLALHYVLHVVKNGRVPGSIKRAWVLSFFLVGPLALPLYWHRHVRTR